MNTSMWHHPTTQRNVRQLRADGVYFIEPDEGEMACGTIGPGRLSEPERIVTMALDLLRGVENHNLQDLAGERLLITTGATREEIDPVRFISNRSSGRMGFALAEAARQRGAGVTVIAGVTSVNPPNGVRMVRANSAEDMYAAVVKALANATIFASAAAISDYRPSKRSASKIKKTESALLLRLERTPDILREVASSRKEGLLVIGFAAETDNLVNNAREKLMVKNLDAIVANDVTRSDGGFDSVTNAITIITRDTQTPVQLPLMTKLDAAHCILDEIVCLRAKGSSPAEVATPLTKRKKA